MIKNNNPYLARREEMQDPRQKTKHQQRVEEFMRKAGQEVPNSPTIPSEEIRLLRANLILEEALETINALGYELDFQGNDQEYVTMETVRFVSSQVMPNIDIHEVVDGCCDIAVVTTGTLSAFGIADVSPQKAVDESNLEKFKPPMCPECGGKTELTGKTGVGSYFCVNGACPNEEEIRGPYRRHDGKWIKPTDWQPPDWEKILTEQGYRSESLKTLAAINDSFGPDAREGYGKVRYRAQDDRIDMGVDLRSCKEWCEYFDTKVIDPDGWRGEYALDPETPISKKDFVFRHMRSTTTSNVYVDNKEFRELMAQIGVTYEVDMEVVPQRSLPSFLDYMQERLTEEVGVPKPVLLGDTSKTDLNVVNEDKIPVGPGDGLRKHPEHSASYYRDKLCPHCKGPISDEAVKRMVHPNMLGGMQSFTCPQCRGKMKIYESDGNLYLTQM